MNKEKLFFKVKYGFSASDQISIEEPELEKALYAQIQGQPVHLGDRYVNGRNIISIAPHFHRHTGWYDSYEPTTGEDFEQINRDCPSYEGIVEHYKNRVHFLLRTGRQQEIGKNISLPEFQKQSVEKIQRSGEMKSLREISNN